MALYCVLLLCSMIVILQETSACVPNNGMEQCFTQYCLNNGRCVVQGNGKHTCACTREYRKKEEIIKGKKVYTEYIHHYYGRTCFFEDWSQKRSETCQIWSGVTSGGVQTCYCHGDSGIKCLYINTNKVICPGYS